MSEPTKDLADIAREATFSVRREVWSHFSQTHNLHLLESEQNDIDHYYEKAFLTALHRAQELDRERIITVLEDAMRPSVERYGRGIPISLDRVVALIGGKVEVNKDSKP